MNMYIIWSSVYETERKEVNIIKVIFVLLLCFGLVFLNFFSKKIMKFDQVEFLCYSVKRVAILPNRLV